MATGLGNPNAIDLYGIPDDSWQTNRNTYVGVTAQNQTTDRWHNSVQFAFAQFGSLNVNPSPTGEPFDPFDSGFPNYLGNVVTVHGANGYSVTGQAILDFSGTYPMIFPDYEARRSVYAQSDYNFFGDWTGVFGFRTSTRTAKDLRVTTTAHLSKAMAVSVIDSSPRSASGSNTTRFSGLRRLHEYPWRTTCGSRPNVGVFGETKLKFNFGEGVKEASTSQQASALINLLIPEQIAQFSVQPIGPERSRTFDFGVDQRLFNGRSILGRHLLLQQFL